MTTFAPFRLFQFTASATAAAKKIDNSPPDTVKEALLHTMAGMERIQAFLGYPCIISSGYRCPQLNAIVGGSQNSQHMKGEACDFTCPGFSIPTGVAKQLSDNMVLLGIDQLILEGTWVHVSFSVIPRYQVYTKRFGKYEIGIIS